MQSGKSTLVRKILFRLRDVRVGGFYTAPLAGGRGEGFQLCSWFGECVPFVRFMQQQGMPVRVPAVDESVFLKQGVRWLHAGMRADWCVIDELGVMECGIHIFVNQVSKVVESGVPLLVVVQERAMDFWLRRFPADRARIYAVTSENRNTLADRLFHDMNQKNA